MKTFIWVATIMAGLLLVWFGARHEESSSPPNRNRSSAIETNRKSDPRASAPDARSPIGTPTVAQSPSAEAPEHTTSIPASDAGAESARSIASQDQLRESLERLDDGLASDPVGDIGQLLADVIKEALRFEHAEELIAAALDRGGFRSEHTRSLMAFALGSILHEDDGVAVDHYEANSAEYRLLLFGARLRVRDEDGALAKFWERTGALRLALRGAFRSLKGFKPLEDLARVAVPDLDNPATPYTFGERPGSAELHYWGASKAVRPLPQSILDDFDRRIGRRDEFDLATRQFVARQVLMRGTRNTSEAAVAAQWLVHEPDGQVRHDLLTAGNFAGLTSEQIGRVWGLVKLGEVDAPAALRVAYGQDRNAARTITVREFPNWAPLVRVTASQEMLTRFEDTAWKLMGTHWDRERDPAVLRALLVEVANAGFPTIASAQAPLLRFGQSHREFIKNAAQDGLTISAAKRWLRFLNE